MYELNAALYSKGQNILLILGFQKLTLWLGRLVQNAYENIFIKVIFEPTDKEMKRKKITQNKKMSKSKKMSLAHLYGGDSIMTFLILFFVSSLYHVFSFRFLQSLHATNILQYWYIFVVV